MRLARSAVSRIARHAGFSSPSSPEPVARSPSATCPWSRLVRSPPRIWCGRRSSRTRRSVDHAPGSPSSRRSRHRRVSAMRSSRRSQRPTPRRCGTRRSSTKSPISSPSDAGATSSRAACRDQSRFAGRGPRLGVRLQGADRAIHRGRRAATGRRDRRPARIAGAYDRLLVSLVGARPHPRRPTHRGGRRRRRQPIRRVGPTPRCRSRERASSVRPMGPSLLRSHRDSMATAA